MNSSALVRAVAPSRHALGFDPLELYAAGIDGSDYVAKVAPLIRAALPRTGDLLDIGAGGGQLGGRLREPGCAWTAVEPSPTMQRRLARLPHGPVVLPLSWESPDVPAGAHDTVLAANMPGPLYQPAPFLDRSRIWARRTIIWVVPSQAGPRGLCLAGCLPPEWHGEDETPGIDLVRAGLAGLSQPEELGRVDWSFRLVVPDIPTIAAYLADRLGWPAEDERRLDMEAHLSLAAEAVAGGFQLTVPRQSAVLLWRLA